MIIRTFIKTNVNVVNKKTHEPTEQDYYIGRPSPLGNPYTHLKSSKASKFLLPTRDEAIDAYEPYFDDKIKSGDTDFIESLLDIIEIYKEFGSVNLVCWCKPKSCHGDYIKKFIEQVLKGERTIDI